MSTSTNPYAAPAAPVNSALALPPHHAGYRAEGHEGAFREGNLLVMHRQARLPYLCVRTGKPATRSLARTLRWHTRWLLLLIFISPVLYVLVSAIATKTVVVHVGLTDEWHERVRKRRMIGLSIIGGLLVLFALGLGLMVAGAAVTSQVAVAVGSVMAPTAILVLIVCAIVHTRMTAMVSAVRITDTYVWVKGVHPSYLDQLPPRW